MQEKDDKEKQKHPTEMTSDELLDYAIAPEVAKHVKQMAKPQDEDPAADCEPED